MIWLPLRPLKKSEHCPTLKRTTKMPTCVNCENHIYAVLESAYIVRKTTLLTTEDTISPINNASFTILNISYAQMTSCTSDINSIISHELNASTTFPNEGKLYATICHPFNWKSIGLMVPNYLRHGFCLQC